ncbi:Na+/H+ antiporter subunit A [Halobacillus litoralis]|uniref:Na+/H+ antiporter subunit A n=1 Tax=Halobacillus litoralis TaxID=45668 RepID=A0A845DQG8_9BACI|nr:MULTISPECIES: Na+/H+ antiporter subunit A [Halobacillus]MCA1021461.1 Na+/H+ antiporter subunit A [Halobacillus litoralis]MYL19851.1 Na+/H+ antiporter subunit A [Halobacillus litoralis]MYL28997.1 Na+/H+ antiporter subunit A [Halobacillus halophilus]MYL37248.1 Na+/H+ antiporter subunit A [Halobacillus litoralis]
MLVAVLLPFILALFIPFLSRWKEKLHPGFFVTLVPVVIFIYFVRHIGTGFEPVIQEYSWIPSLGMNMVFHLDGLSLLFALLISGIGALVAFYSIYYLHKSEQLGHFYVYFLIFMGSMLGVVLSDNVFALYSFWEFTSLSSFLLIGFWNYKQESRYGALKSMLITVFGGLSLLGALVYMSVLTNTTSIRAMIDQQQLVLNSEYFPLILCLLLLGAFTKSAQFPFHIWLPDAMEAPTPVSAYLHSATMVKAGIYLVARYSPMLSSSEWFFIIVSTAGIVTLCWGSYMAVRQTDLKGILAFSTISQLGMIMAMLGFGTKAAVFGAVFHILNHATFKGSLFMVAGIIDHETGTRDIRRLGGLMTYLPITATLALFASFSMAGVPLPFLNGFYSKEIFFDSSLHLEASAAGFSGFMMSVIPYLAVLGSIFTFVYSMYFFFGTFRGRAKLDQLPKKPHEAPIGMLVSPMILVAGVIIIGLFPFLVNGSFIAHAADAVKGTALDEKHITFWHGIIPPFVMSLTVVVFGAILAISRKVWTPVYNFLPGRLSLNKFYDGLVDRTERYSGVITKGYMNGSLGRYVRLILAAILIVSFAFMAVTGGFTVDTSNLSRITAPEIAVAVTMVLAAVGTALTNNRIAAILILGVVGYGLSMLFVLYRAPDLALTQLIVETVTVALFLLVFYHLPKLRKKDQPVSTQVLNVIISVGFGALMTMVAISAHSSKWFDSIAEYFVKNSYKLGGGDNIVNVILVDFRGLDTLFEIVVLGIAAMAIFGLIRLKKPKEGE